MGRTPLCRCRPAGVPPDLGGASDSTQWPQWGQLRSQPAPAAANFCSAPEPVVSVFANVRASATSCRHCARLITGPRNLGQCLPPNSQSSRHRVQTTTPPPKSRQRRARHARRRGSSTMPTPEEPLSGLLMGIMRCRCRCFGRRRSADAKSTRCFLGQYRRIVTFSIAGL